MLLIREFYMNEDKGYWYDYEEYYRSHTDDLGMLYKSLQKKYGRCLSRINPYDRIIYYFLKRMPYDDNSGTYLQKTKIVIRDVQETEKIQLLNMTAEVYNVTDGGVYARTEDKRSEFFSFTNYKRTWFFIEGKQNGSI